MLPDWNELADNAQVALSREALHRAAAIVAAQAEVLAEEIECGRLADRGGGEALRLFAAVVRVSDGDDFPTQGMAETAAPFEDPGAPLAGAAQMRELCERARESSGTKPLPGRFRGLLRDHD